MGTDANQPYLSDPEIFWTPISSSVKWGYKEYPPHGAVTWISETVHKPCLKLCLKFLESPW